MKPCSRPFRWFIFLCVIWLLTPMAFAQTARQPLSAHLPAEARMAQSVGRMAPAEPLSVAITLPFRNRAALTNLLRQINDPGSPNYHHYLTREQFTEQFGPSEEDYNALKKFADSNGLRINAEHANRMLLEVGGTAADMERVFHTTLNVYRHPTEARTFYAPASDPSVDATVPVLSVLGLDNFALAQPRLKSVSSTALPNAQPNSGSGPGGSYSGSDFRSVYASDTSLTGAGQVVGLLQFDGYTAADISYYESHAGLPSVTLSNVLLNGASGLPSSGNGPTEVSLDIEMAISMAPGLSQVIVYEAPNPSPFEIILNRMVSDNAARQLSCSWFVPNGGARASAEQIFQEMAAQGQSFFSASGDNDAYTGLVDFPSDSPNITQVGGTTLSTSGPGGTRTAEIVWNNGSGVGTGGGISTQYGIPYWQTNIDMSGNQGSSTKRNIPDVALTADNIYVRVNGQDLRVRGTSCSAPLWAGFAALANQRAADVGQPPIGFINPAVYKICSGTSYALCFVDITSGDNTSSSSPSKFFAKPGYDLCTGWGVPNGKNLIEALANPEALHITPLTGFSSIGGVGGPFTITSQDLTLTNAGTNSLTWTLVNPVPWLDAAPTGGTLDTHASILVPVSLNSFASNLTAGDYTGALLFTNLTSHAGFERDFSISIISPPSITTQPADQSVLDGQPAAFSVQATGGLPLFYQWQLDGTNIADGIHFTGTTSANLVITNVSIAQTGIYTVVITNLADQVTSDGAELSIADSAPIVVMQPADQTAVAGKTATFSVTAVGNKPFYYQWSYGGPGGTNIDGATNATLTIANVQPSDAGLYSVTVSNLLGATPSADAQLTVLEIPTITSFTPAAGSSGTNVSINGLNFNDDPSSNLVRFGAVRAIVTSASPTNLVVTVPLGATFAPITVTVSGLTAFSSQPFLPVFAGLGQIDQSSLKGPVILNTDNGPIRVVIGDLNDDGKPDLIVANASDGTILVYQNISTDGALTTNSFAPPVTLPSDGNATPYGLAVADLDGDGKLDIVDLDVNNDIVSVFRNVGTGQTITSDSFAPSIDLPAGSAMRGVAIRDLNQDGKPDIVVANNGDGTISIFQNQGSPGTISFADRVNMQAPSGPFGVAIGDMDGDGNPDIVVVNNGSAQSVVSIFQNPGINDTITTNSFLPRVDLAGNYSAEGLAIGDLDRDGRLDIVLGSPTGGKVSVFRSAFSGGVITSSSFDPVVDFAAGIVNSVALADIDGDGRLDIAASCQGLSMLSIYKNISTPGSFTTGSLAADVQYAAGSNPSGVALGDLDGDGRPDVVFGNFYDQTLSIYKNVAVIQGAPLITLQPTNVTVLAGSTATFTVGASGDAPLFYQWHFDQTNDIVGATNNILTLTNAQKSDEGLYSVTITNVHGAATSTNATLQVNPVPSDVPIIASFTPSSGTPGDIIILTGSGFSDVASSNIVYFGAVQAVVIAASTTNLSVTVPPGATFDRITVTVNALTGASASPFIPTFPGTGSFTVSSLAGRVDFNTLSGPLATAIADLDGDGKPDLIVGNGSANSVSIFRNISTNGILDSNSFAPRVDLFLSGTGGSSPYSIAVGDLDGDGKLDIVALNASGKQVSIFRNISQPGTITAASFASRIVLSGGNNMRHVVLGDLDGDGKIEIIETDNGDGTVSVFKNQGTPGNISFAARVPFPTPAGSFGVSITDVDGDGRNDIVTVNNGAGGSGAMSVLRNVTTAGIINAASFSPHVDFPGSASAEALAIGDIDGDGKLDVVAGSPTGQQIMVYRNTSTPGTIDTNSFAPEVTFGGGGVVNSVALADIDGDGKIDVAVAAQGPGSFSIFKNVSAPGSFTTASLNPPVTFSSGSNPNGIAIGDLDGDGRPDIAFANFYDNNVSIYKNISLSGIPPAITSQPTNFAATVGSNATFSVTVTGTGPLIYQWYHNETNQISNATNSTILLTNVQVADAGLYSVTVSNLLASLTSSNATLTVTGFDHFTWGIIASPRFSGAPFAVTISARDTTNSVYTNFTGTVALSSTNGLPISPQISNNFTNGVWSGSITVPQVASGLVLLANDGSGHVGLANAIDVVSRPSLGTVNFGTSLLFSWPQSPTGFVLESSSTLLPGTWSPASGSAIPFNGQYLQSVPFTNTNQFFRLRFIGP